MRERGEEPHLMEFSLVGYVNEKLSLTQLQMVGPTPMQRVPTADTEIERLQTTATESGRPLLDVLRLVRFRGHIDEGQKVVSTNFQRDGQPALNVGEMNSEARCGSDSTGLRTTGLFF